jgi:hypothetical protein
MTNLAKPFESLFLSALFSSTWLWHMSCSLPLPGELLMKTMNKNTIWFLNGMLAGGAVFLIGLWGLLAMMEWATAATYNVFFNNVEQGPNSTASPTLHITGSKPEAQPASVSQPETPTVEAPQNPVIESPKVEAPKTSVTPAPISETRATVADVSDVGPKYFRAAFVATSFFSPGESAANRPIGAAIRASFFPLRDFGISAFAGAVSGRPAYFGGELEFEPIHLGLFGVDRFVEVGTVVGASSIDSRQGWDRVHGGVQTALNFGSRYSLTAGLRTHLSNQNLPRDWMADAGVSLRF